jgi:hypothetical protein
MRLKNRNPAMFVGRTIIFRHQAWKIDSVAGDTIHLSKPGLAHKGQLRLHQFADCRLFPTREEVFARFPKLIRALGRVCNLSQSRPGPITWIRKRSRCSAARLTQWASPGAAVTKSDVKSHS